MAPKKESKDSKSKNKSTKKQVSKRVLEQNEDVGDSPKKTRYNPGSSSLEKRDFQYCKEIKTQSVRPLKVFRVNFSDEDDSDDFVGFIRADVDDNNDLVKRTVATLEKTKELLEEYHAARPPGADDSFIFLPEAAPLDEEMENPSNFEDTSHECELPFDILHLIPPPPTDSEDDSSEDEIKYTIREAATRKGNSVIEDSRGYTYSYQRKSKGTIDPPKYTYWICIKRNWKTKQICNSFLRIEKFEQGENNMIVSRQGQKHNHEQDFANIMRKQINEQLKIKALNFPKTKSGDIVDEVLKENEEFQKIFETGAGLPSKASMKRLVQKTRKHLKPPTVKDPNFDLNITWIIPDFFRAEVRTKKARHFIFCNNTQLMYMSEALIWYIDGTFKIVKDPVKQLLTVHVVLLCDKKRVSIPVCFILMSRRRKIDYIDILLEINKMCNIYRQVKPGNNVCKLKRIMCDFEIALWQAARELRDKGHFSSDLNIKGCYFHLTQAILRKAWNFGLKKDYYNSNNSCARVFIKWLMSLVLLPETLMKPTFNSMHEKIKEYNCKKLLNLYKYYDNNWIDGPNWSTSDICQWGQAVRTNNDAERFHMKLMGSVQKTGLDFYDIVNILGEFGSNTMTYARMFVQGMIVTYKRKRFLSFEQELREASIDLRDNVTNSFQFLNRISTSAHDNQLIDETWGINHSRIDMMPEEDDDENSSESECVNSDDSEVE